MFHETKHINADWLSWVQFPLDTQRANQSQVTLKNINKQWGRQKIPLSSRLLSFVVPLARKKKSEEDCVTKKEGIFLPFLCSCSVKGRPALFSFSPPSPPDLFLPLFFTLRAHALVDWHCWSPKAKQLSTRIHWILKTDTADLLWERNVKKQKINRGGGVKNTKNELRVFINRPLEMPSPETDSSSAVRQFWWSKTRQKWQRDWVGFFGLVSIETIVLPSSFLPCIPTHNAMKSKLPLPQSRFEWYTRWRFCRLKDAQGAWKNNNKKSTQPHRVKWSWNCPSTFTRWSFFSGLRVTWYQVDRFLSLALSSAEPDSKVFKEQRNNTHED